MKDHRSKRVGPLEFIGQVRAEGAKVTWPSRRETLLTSVMVGVMVIFASVFFLLVDWGLASAVGAVLGD